MTSILLVVIYLAFISLGLPDSLLGSAWPVMHVEMGAAVASAGNISLVIALGTVVSSLSSDRMIARFGTGKVTACSVGMTAAALFGFSFSKAYYQLLLWAVPYGLGAGAVDAALNNYVALHYKSRHMSWLHCMWGVGASAGPYIMGWCLSVNKGWPAGYQTIGLIQIVLTVLLFMTLGLWKQEKTSDIEEKRNVLSLREALHLPGAAELMLAFVCYSAIESSTGLWASSFLHEVHGVDAVLAASFGSLFFLGITAGRAVSGFLSEKLGDTGMIRLGLGIILAGVILCFGRFAETGLVVLGLGCAPVYPSIIHSTPAHFGAENSQSLVGIEMAAAYTGTTLMPKLFGMIGEIFGMRVFPLFLCVAFVVLSVMTEIVERKANGNEHQAF